MQIENRFHALAADPVDRVIRVHARSLARAKRRPSCDQAAPACREADAGQGRFIINALRREIDRLLRGIDRFDATYPQPHRLPQEIPNGGEGNRAYEADAEAMEFARLASADNHRRSYAVSPLGAPLASLAGDASPNRYAAAAPQFHGTNPDGLGALIDVLT